MVGTRAVGAGCTHAPRARGTQACVGKCFPARSEVASSGAFRGALSTPNG